MREPWLQFEEELTSLCVNWGLAVEDGNYPAANFTLQHIEKIRSELYLLDNYGTDTFKNMMKSNNSYVKLVGAESLLQRDPDCSKPVLRELEESNSSFASSFAAIALDKSDTL